VSHKPGGRLPLLSARHAVTPATLKRASPKPHPRCQHFGLPASALGAEATEGPQVTVELGPTRVLLRSWTILEF